MAADTRGKRLSVLTTELPACHQSLSLRLFQVLEDIGASTKIRQLMKENRTMYEILNTIIHQPEISCYIFGSAFEGTTTPGMDSDVDAVYIVSDLPVIMKLADAQAEKCLLMRPHKSTPPDYAKLQLVTDRTQLYRNSYLWAGNLKYFQRKRFLLSSAVDDDSALICSYTPHQELLKYRERHGPALSRPSTALGQLAVDKVNAVRANQIPECAHEWFSRPRLYNWPAPDIIDTCKTLGCLFVPVGHPKSDQQDFQWRVSFSHQERLLISHFAPVQLKCYIILKLVKKEIVYHFLKRDTISSYHCKTCMFYLIENTPNDFWKPENLSVCLVQCIKLLLIWVESGICPNYFLPKENMFEGKVERTLRGKLCDVLQSLLSADFRYLAHIKCDELGSRLQLHCLSLPGPVRLIMRNLSREQSLERQLHEISEVLASITGYRNMIIWDYGENSSNLYSKIHRLKQTLQVTDHTETETEEAIPLVLPYIQLSWMSCLIASAVGSKDGCPGIWTALTCDKWHEIKKVSDALTSKLKKATFMYMLNYYEAAADILSSVRQCERISVCRCNPFQPVNIDSTMLLKIVNGRENMKRNDILKIAVSPCILFLPAEKHLLPSALAYEMLRSVGVPSRSREEYLYHWYDWTVIDGQFLLHFLLYLIYAKLDNSIQSSKAIKDMEKTINTIDISHRESCLNLLGWVYKDQGRVDRAKECFQKSLEIEPLHNAAHWHLKDIN